MSQDIDRKPKDDLAELLYKIQSNLVDDVDDLDDQISELKGVLNEALGDLPFKFAILLVVFLNFLYTSYDAFFATGRITVTTIPNECYCDPVDRTFYRTVMMLSTIFWTLFLYIYILYSTCGLKRILVVCTQHKLKTGDSRVRDDLVKLIDVLEKKEKKFKTQLRELVTTKFLDDEHCESIRKLYYNTSLYWTKTDTDSSADPSDTSCTNGNSVQSTMLESGPVTSGDNNAVQQNNTGQLQAHSRQDTVSEQTEVISNANTSTASDIELVNPSQGSNDYGQVNDQEPQTLRWCSRWCCFTVLKVSLIAVRFVFRLLIVPLLQLQLLNDYAWYCLLNDVIRNYCETETNKYYIGLDHSMVNYCVYILLLIALLFSFLINWFPKGIPQLVLLYKAGRIMINKKRYFKSQFEYQELVNESDID